MGSIQNRNELIGSIVWNMVLGDNTQDGRALYLLVGLTPDHLIGISRTFPEDTGGRKVRLAIDLDIAPEKLQHLPPDHLLNAPIVRLRNAGDEDILLIAADNKARDTVGASLNPVTRIDRRAIQSHYELWQEVIWSLLEQGLGDDKKTWLRHMIEGLDRSGIAETLDQFAGFLLEFAKLKGERFDERLNRAIPVLHLPKNCLPQLPSGRKTSPKLFRDLFAGVELLKKIPYLLNKKDESFDCDEIQARLDEFKVSHGTGTRKIPDSTTIQVVEQLIADRIHLRYGDWLPSQEKFCWQFDWNLFGEKVFGPRRDRGKAKKLGQRTLEFFEEEYPRGRVSRRPWPER